MPGYVVHEGATVTCMHGGQAQPTAPFPRVTVGGQAVVTQAGPYAVAGCGLTGTPAPPCVTAQWLTASTRVTGGGAPLVLQDSQSICSASGTKLQIVLTQLRVQAQ
jgi:hypothetical protein